MAAKKTLNEIMNDGTSFGDSRLPKRPPKKKILGRDGKLRTKVEHNKYLERQKKT